MRLWVQWTRAIPQDWEQIDVPNISRWRQTPKKPDPTATLPEIDNQPGWVALLGFMGMTLSGDHYAVEMNPDGPGIRIHIVNDDPTDWPPGLRHAKVWTMRPIRDDPRFGRRNTDISLTVYAEPEAVATYWPRGLQTTAGPAVFLPWSAYSPPNANLIRHGIQVSDELWEMHTQARSPLPGYDDPEWQS